MSDENPKTNEGAEVLRAEIDTSAPFESVREAASRFGGIGFWKPSHGDKSPESSPESKDLFDIQKLKEQTEQLQNDLLLKEQETLDAQKQLNSTKLVIDELKTKLQKEINSTIVSDKNLEESDKENLFTNLNAAVAPEKILVELKQAKLNITKIAHARASVASLNDKLETEKALLEKSRERLTNNSSKVSHLEDELKQTTLRLHLAKDGPQRLHKLSSEVEQFKKLGQAARSEVQRTVSEIEKTRAQIKVAETNRVAAVRMKEAARAAEAMARQEIKALSENNNSEVVTLTYEEYASLIRKAEEAESLSTKKIVDAIHRVNEANMSKAQILKKLEEAKEEVKSKKKVLEEALGRIEDANRGKLAAEESLRNCKSERRRKRRKSRAKQSLKQTLSIGQILSQKLQVAEEFESSRKVAAKYPLKRMSLRDLLSKANDDDKSEMGIHFQHQYEYQKQLSAKRKKSGFGRFSFLMAKQKKMKKKMLTCDLR